MTEQNEESTPSSVTSTQAEYSTPPSSKSTQFELPKRCTRDDFPPGLATKRKFIFHSQVKLQICFRPIDEDCFSRKGVLL